MAPQRSVNVTLKLEVATALGVPVSKPDEESAKPAGRVPGVSDHVNGAAPGGSYTALVANWRLYGVPTIPAGSGDAFVICGAGLQCSVSPEWLAVARTLSVT